MVQNTSFTWQVPPDLLEQLQAARTCLEPIAGSLDQIKVFIGCLFEHEDLVEVRSFPGSHSSARSGQIWTYAEQIGSYINDIDRVNRFDRCHVTVGVNPRKNRGGTDQDVALARCLFADFDNTSPEQVQSLLQEKNYPYPTVLVSSGHGCHAYWRTKQAISDLDLWQKAQQQLIESLGSDPAVKDRPRVMRLPGTYNLKANPIPCEIVAANRERVYSLNELLPRRPVCPSPPASEPPTSSCNVHGRLAQATRDFIQHGAPHGNRNNRLFNAACDLAGNGFKQDQVIDLLTSPAKKCGLAQEEIDRTIRSAFERPRTPSRPPATESSEPTDDNGGGPERNRPGSETAGNPGRPVLSNVTDRRGRRLYKPLPQIVREVRELTGGWPRVCNGVLFYVTGSSTPLPKPTSIHLINEVPELFAFLSTICDIRWTNKEAIHPTTKKPMNPPSKEEFFAALASDLKFSSATIEVLPHEPQLDDAYYLPVNLPPPKPLGEPDSPLTELVSKLNPKTEEDRCLMLAAILTPGWGGPPGARPAICLESEHGRGTGKTQTAHSFGRIWGGITEVGAKEDRGRLISRLIDDTTKRCVLIDNVKGTLSDADLERLITSDTIQGWRLFCGHGERPNYLTWFITSNTPAMSNDLVERSVLVQVGDKQHAFDFVTWSRKYIARHRPAIIAELLAILRSPAKCQIRPENRDRWAAWQDAILSRFSNGNELAALIKERRAGADSDLEEARGIYRAVRDIVEQHAADFEARKILIPRDVLREKLCQMQIVDKDKMSPKATTTLVKSQCGTGPLGCLSNKHTDTGDVWLYTGPKSIPDQKSEEYKPRWRAGPAGGLGPP